MKNYKLKIEEIIEYFGYNNPFSSQELYQFYCNFEGSLNKGTFRWRVYYLKENGIIRSLKRGTYILEERKIYAPTVSLSLKRLFNNVKREFPYLDISIWDTSWLHDFMNHQPFSSITILEVDKEAVESAFNFLRQIKSNVFLKPTSEEVENYILNENVIVIVPIIKESPIIENNKVRVPKIEKILVDLYAEKELLSSYQGQEMINIFERIYKYYSINATTLYRYARNRGIKERLLNFITRDTNIDRNYI